MRMIDITGKIMATDNKKQAVIIISVLLILSVLLALMMTLRERKFEEREKQRMMMDKDTVTLDSIEFSEIPLSDLGVTVNGVEEGYQMLEIFNYMEVDADTISGVIFYARDGGRLKVHRNNIIDKKVFIVPQPAVTDTTYRLVIPQDTFRTRWLKDIFAIEVD